MCVADTVFVDFVRVCRSQRKVIAVVVYMANVGISMGVNLSPREAGGNDTQQHEHDYYASLGNYHWPISHRPEHCHKPGNISMPVVRSHTLSVLAFTISPALSRPTAHGPIAIRASGVAADSGAGRAGHLTRSNRSTSSTIFSRFWAIVPSFSA